MFIISDIGNTYNMFCIKLMDPLHIFDERRRRGMKNNLTYVKRDNYSNVVEDGHWGGGRGG